MDLEHKSIERIKMASEIALAHYFFFLDFAEEALVNDPLCAIAIIDDEVFNFRFLAFRLALIHGTVVFTAAASITISIICGGLSLTGSRLKTWRRLNYST